MKSSILFLLFTVVVSAAAVPITTAINVYAQTPPPVPPPLEESKPVTEPTTLGKITIQISQTEQLVIDLPLKSENKYQVIPIK